jgi:predicted Zn-ribbon and HTH transcriptional regulator
MMTPIAPKETLQRARESISEMNKTASELANTLYNMYLLKVLPQVLAGVQGPTQVMQVPNVQTQEQKKDEFTEGLMQAYLNALKVKAFHSVLGTQPEAQQAQQKKDDEEEKDLATEFAKAFAKLLEKDPAKAKEVLSTLTEEDIQKIALFSKITGKINPLLPLLTLKDGSEKRSDRSSELVEVTKSMMDALKTGFEMGRAQQQQQSAGQGDSFATTLLKILMEHVLREKDDETKQLLSQLYESLEKKENIYEKILTDEKFRDGLRNFFSREGVPSELNAELEKMKLDLEKFKAEKAIEIQKWQAEKEWELKKQENLTKTLEAIFQGPPGKLIDSAVSKVVGGIGKSAAAQAAGQVAKMITAKCGECGAVFQVAEGLKTVKCPSCGVELEMP